MRALREVLAAAIAFAAPLAGAADGVDQNGKSLIMKSAPISLRVVPAGGGRLAARFCGGGGPSSCSSIGRVDGYEAAEWDEILGICADQPAEEFARGAVTLMTAALTGWIGRTAGMLAWAALVPKPESPASASRPVSSGDMASAAELLRSSGMRPGLYVFDPETVLAARASLEACARRFALAHRRYPPNGCSTPLFGCQENSI